MTRANAIAVAAAIWVGGFVLTGRAAAQAVPFFGRGASIFDPEIGVVQSGVVNDVQATVSADRKYVTMNMRLDHAQLLSLQEFAFQRGTGFNGAGGFVGGVGGGGNAGGANPGAVGGGGANGGAAAGRAGVLNRPGMTLLGRATRVSPRARR